MQIVRCDRLGRIVLDKTTRKDMGNTFAILREEDRIILMAMQKNAKAKKAKITRSPVYTIEGRLLARR
ncbi:MAG: hypothetical protein A2Z88_00095 [Omnitrophica WOR_2 bacterium GWA2_47_8]|nr:MAG: hypothetical protein A2Z88_00095 [Omnitrophica WOR_2 bacterium GWA2_47_8]